MRRAPLLALSVLAAAALWLVLGRDAPPAARGVLPDAAPPQTPDAAEDVRAARVGPERTPAPSGAPRALAAPMLAGPVVFATERGRAELEIVVEDTRRAPVAEAAVLLRSHGGPRPELYDLADERGVEQRRATDAHGSALFADLPTGPYEAAVTPPGGGLPSALVLLLEAPRGRFVVRIEDSTAPAAFSVHVQAADGQPVADARVELTGGVGNTRAGRVVRTQVSTALTAADGRASIADPGYQGFVVVATAPDGRSGTATAWVHGLHPARTRGLTVVVGDAARLEGGVRGLPPERLSGARVLARFLNNTHPHYTTHGIESAAPVVDGRYAFTALPAGLYTLALDDPGGARLDLPPLANEGGVPNSVDPLEVELTHGAITLQDLDARVGGILAGRVLDAAGRPLAGAVVRATYAPFTSNVPDGFVLLGAHVWRFDSDGGGEDEHPETHRRARTDGTGRYRLAGLHPGRHRVEVIWPGHTYERREDVVLADGSTTELEHVLAPAGMIAGVARDGSYVGVLRPGAATVEQAAILPPEGLFSFPGLAPGAWAVARLHSDASIAPVELVTVTVEAGRTRWVDLDQEGRHPVRLAGRVLLDGAPVAGASVRSSSRWVTTDEAGRFELASAFALTGYVGFSVAREGLVTRFKLPAMQAGEREWSGDLELGPQRLTLRALDASGAPSAAQLELGLDEIREPGIEAVHGDGLSIDASGERELLGLPAGKLGVTARFPDGSQAYVVVALPGAEELLLQAPPAGVVEVTVLGPDGSPRAGAAVQAWTWTGTGEAPEGDADLRNGSAWHSGETGADGRAELAGVRAGTVLVEVRPRGFFGGTSELATPERLSLLPGGRAQALLRLER